MLLPAGVLEVAGCGAGQNVGTYRGAWGDHSEIWLIEKLHPEASTHHTPKTVSIPPAPPHLHCPSPGSTLPLGPEQGTGGNHPMAQMGYHRLQWGWHWRGGHSSQATPIPAPVHTHMLSNTQVPLLPHKASTAVTIWPSEGRGSIAFSFDVARLPGSVIQLNFSSCSLYA